MRAATSDRYKELARRPRAEWARLFSHGERPSFDALEGGELRVWNATPAILGPLRLRKMIKVMYRNAEGEPRGWTALVEQNDLDGPWIKRDGDARSSRLASFRVRRDPRRPQTLVLDYRFGLRDYITRVDEGSDDLLLGRAYLGFGRVEVPVIWFLLQRHRPADL